MEENILGRNIVSPEIEKGLIREEIRDNLNLLTARSELLSRRLERIITAQGRPIETGIDYSRLSEEERSQLDQESTDFFLAWKLNFSKVGNFAPKINQGSECLRMAGHDLGISLTKYQNGLELSQVDPEIGKEFAQNVNPVIFQHVGRILKGFSDELLEEGVPENIDFNQLTREAILPIKVSVLRKGIKVDLEEAVDLPVFTGKSNDLYRVLFNLLKNSEKAVTSLPEESNKTIVVKLEKTKAGIKITISDSGRGINTQEVVRGAVEAGLIKSSEAEDLSEEEKINLIFSGQVSGFARVGTGGSGLGLRRCRQIVEDHRGKLTARNKGEGGAEFTIEFSAKDGKLGVE